MIRSVTRMDRKKITFKNKLLKTLEDYLNTEIQLRYNKHLKN